MLDNKNERKDRIPDKSYDSGVCVSGNHWEYIIEKLELTAVSTVNPRLDAGASCDCCT